MTPELVAIAVVAYRLCLPQRHGANHVIYLSDQLRPAIRGYLLEPKK